tara:strand:+ start:1704 stop:2810 length:1107 start_codon:yes stop_codon:yes gene_type:complete
MKKYELPFHEDEGLLIKFLETWSISNVEKMTLGQYTDINNKNTFTQWVENRTSQLGGIRGRIGSSKFGIYKRRSSTHEKNLISNETHSWIKFYGESNYDEKEVFKKVKIELLNLIFCAQRLDFDAIEKMNGFYEIYKWKLAFLYSNQSMIPVFNQSLLKKFTAIYGMKHSKKIEYAKMHRFLYNQKPPNLSVFNFMRKLMYEAGLPKKFKSEKPPNSSKSKRTRKGTETLNSDNLLRKGSEGTIVTQQHKEFQKQLKKYLEAQFPTAMITFEKNFIDLLLISNQEVHYYEVKTALTPEACIKQGLGQLLNYSYFEEQILGKYKGLTKKIVIFGKWKAKSFDLEFINYINNSLSVNFEYLSLDEITQNN